MNQHEEMIREWFDVIEELRKIDSTTYEKIEETSNKEWLSIIKEELSQAESPLKLIEGYISLLSSKRIVKEGDFKVSDTENKIVVQISGNYSYAVRSPGFFSYLIENILGQFFNYEEKKESGGVSIELMPGSFMLKVTITPGEKRGSVRVSDKDLEKLNLDMVEEVIVTPLGKEAGIAEIMFSSSKVSPGFITMSPMDATRIGVKNRDRVEIEIAEKPEEEKTENEKGKTEEDSENSETEETVESDEPKKVESLVTSKAEESSVGSTNSKQDIDEQIKENVKASTEQQDTDNEETSEEETPEKTEEEAIEEPIKEEEPEPKKNKPKIKPENKEKQKKDFEKRIEDLKN